MSSGRRNTGFVFAVGLTGRRDISVAAMTDVRMALRTELEALKARFASLSISICNIVFT